jgi:enoyl-CoA hydratase/carnithine racemase
MSGVNDVDDVNDVNASEEQPAVLTEQRGRVLLITLNRPEAMNAMCRDGPEGVLAW